MALTNDMLVLRKNDKCEAARDDGCSDQARTGANAPSHGFLLCSAKTLPRGAGITTARSMENCIYLVINWPELAVLLPDARNCGSRIALQRCLCGGGVQRVYGSRLVEKGIYYPARRTCNLRQLISNTETVVAEYCQTRNSGHNSLKTQSPKPPTLRSEHRQTRPPWLLTASNSQLNIGSTRSSQKPSSMQRVPRPRPECER